MLNKGLKSEEEQRINAILERMTTIVLLPENWNESLMKEELQSIGLDIDGLKSIDSTELHQHLVNDQFPWNKMEQFADILVKWSQKPGYEELRPKAKNLYQYIQTESKAFSFDIFNKISRL